jgi:hypothetical protein
MPPAHRGLRVAAAAATLTYWSEVGGVKPW